MGTHVAAATAPARGRRRTKLAALGAGAAVLAVGTGFALAGGANAATPAVAYTVTSSWDGGYVGQYTISNHTSAAISGWTVMFTLALEDPPQLSHATITTLYLPAFRLRVAFSLDPFEV